MYDIEKKIDFQDKIQRAMVKILDGTSFKETARYIFDICCNATGATSGYVALLNEKGNENEVLFLEAGGNPCSVDPTLPMPIRGLRAESYKSMETVFNNDFMNSKYIKMMPAGHMDLKNVMFAPLNIDGKTRGIMGLANKSSDFTHEDVEFATYFGDLAALALNNSRLKEKLAKNEEMFRNLVEHSNRGVLLFQNDSIIYANQIILDLLECTQEEILKKSFSDFIQEKEINKLSERVDAVFEIELITKNGTAIPCEINLIPLSFDNKNSIQMIIKNLSLEKKNEVEKKKLQAELYHSAKLASIGELAAGLGHEINNPMTIISGHVTLLSQELCAQTEEIQKSFDLIKNSIKRVTEIVAGLRTFAEKDEKSELIFDAHNAILSCEALSRKIFKSKKIEFITDFKAKKSNIRGGEGSFQHIMMNFFNNAKDSMLNSSVKTLTVRTRNENHFLKIEITDTGCGIPEENLEKIFDAFYTTKGPGGGTGLGLNINHNLVEFMNGKINVVSKVNEGTTFTLTLLIANHL